MALVYCAVAKYLGVVLCEYVKEGTEGTAKLARSKLKEVYKEQQEIMLEKGYALYSLKPSDDTKAQFVCVALQDETYDEKVYKFLEQLRNDFFRVCFGGHITEFVSAPSLETKQYQTRFEKQMTRLLQNYETGIGFKRTRVAQAKVDELTQTVQHSLKTQLAVNKQQLDLLVSSQEMKEMGKTLVANTQKFEDQINRQAFWWCSRNCLILCGVPLFVVLFYVCVSFIYCGDLSALIGCRYKYVDNPTHPPNATNSTNITRATCFFRS